MVAPARSWQQTVTYTTPSLARWRCARRVWICTRQSLQQFRRARGYWGVHRLRLHDTTGWLRSLGRFIAGDNGTVVRTAWGTWVWARADL